MNKVKTLKKVAQYTFGPITMVKQSFGTNLGKGVADQYRIWRENNSADIRQMIQRRSEYDLEKKCIENKRTERDVRIAYRNVRVTLGILWLINLGCVSQLVVGSAGLSGALLLAIGVVATLVSIAAAIHHQICIREKTFLSPVETLAFCAANPAAISPRSLPANWKLDLTADGKHGNTKKLTNPSQHRKIKITRK